MKPHLYYILYYTFYYIFAKNTTISHDITGGSMSSTKSLKTATDNGFKHTVEASMSFYGVSKILITEIFTILFYGTFKGLYYNLYYKKGGALCSAFLIGKNFLTSPHSRALPLSKPQVYFPSVFLQISWGK